MVYVFCNMFVGALYQLPEVVFKVFITGPNIFFSLPAMSNSRPAHTLMIQSLHSSARAISIHLGPLNFNDNIQYHHLSKLCMSHVKLQYKLKTVSVLTRLVRTYRHHPANMLSSMLNLSNISTVAYHSAEL